MSARLPPHVEFSRDGTAGYVVGDLVDAAARHDAAHLGLLAECDHVGLHAELPVGPAGSGQAATGLNLVEDQQRIVPVAQLAHGGEELRPEVAVPAFALDRFGHKAGDVVRVGLEAARAWASDAASSAATSAPGRI